MAVIERLMGISGMRAAVQAGADVRLLRQSGMGGDHSPSAPPPSPRQNAPRMSTLGKLFFRGLAAILPVALTGYLVYAAVAAGEHLLRGFLVWLFEELDVEWHYWPGMGFAVSIVLVTAVGLLTYSFVLRAIYRRITAALQRIPVVKSVYGMIVDVMQLFGGESKPFHKVVLVRREDGAEQLGFLTREDFKDMEGFGEDRVAVYLPMSYQLGGFTVIVPRWRVREVPRKAEEALRFCVTAGVMRHPDQD